MLTASDLEAYEKWLQGDATGQKVTRRGARMNAVNLRGRNLQRLDFSGAYCCGADFTGADLRGAVFNGAKLVGADFSGADLRGAVFNGAYLEGAEFGYIKASLTQKIGLYIKKKFLI